MRMCLPAGHCACQAVDDKLQCVLDALVELKDRGSAGTAATTAVPATGTPAPGPVLALPTAVHSTLTAEQVAALPPAAVGGKGIGVGVGGPGLATAAGVFTPVAPSQPLLGAAASAPPASQPSTPSVVTASATAALLTPASLHPSAPSAVPSADAKQAAAASSHPLSRAPTAAPGTGSGTATVPSSGSGSASASASGSAAPAVGAVSTGLSFADIVKMVESGVTPPGVKDIPNGLSVDAATLLASACNATRSGPVKPWEVAAPPAVVVTPAVVDVSGTSGGGTSGGGTSGGGTSGSSGGGNITGSSTAVTGIPSLPLSPTDGTPTPSGVETATPPPVVVANDGCDGSDGGASGDSDGDAKVK